MFAYKQFNLKISCFILYSVFSVPCIHALHKQDDVLLNQSLCVVFKLLSQAISFPFFFGCTGSFVLHAGFLQLWRAGATQLQCSGSSLQCLVAEHRLWAPGFSSCSLRAQVLHSMWNLPGPETTPVSPVWAGRFLSTMPPGKFNKLLKYLYKYFLSYTSKLLLHHSGYSHLWEDENYQHFASARSCFLSLGLSDT